MRILATIVIPPHLMASGAVNAAMAISQSLRRHCDIDVALMADETCQEHRQGLTIYKRRSKSPIDFTRGWLPNKYRTLFYRSDIDRLIDNYDLVHIHNAIPAFEMRRIAKRCIGRNIPYVLTTHGFVEILGLQSAYQLNRFQQLVGRICMRRPLEFVIARAHHICCLAPQDRALLLEQSIAPDKLSTIPNGVAKEFYREPAAEEVSAVLRKFDLPSDKPAGLPVCFFLANHTRNKGLDILLDAFVQTERPYCLIVGGRKRQYDYDRYQARVRPGQRLIFTDRLSDAEIRCLHHYSDLFVFPSRADTLPLVVLEAMAAARPVLSTRVGGIPFQIDDTCGRLVEPENPLALRDAFEQLTSDPEALKAMGQAALKKVRANFDWERSADLTADVYRRILGLKGPRSSATGAVAVD